MASEKLFGDIPPFPEDIKTARMYTIPLTDLHSNYDIAKESLFNACQELGFFLLDLRGDEMGEAMMVEIEQLWDLMQKTMNLPQEIKDQHLRGPPDNILGFKPRGEAKTETKEPDRFEWFNIGQDGLLDNTSLHKVPDLVRSQKDLLKSFLLHGQNVVTTINESLATSLDLPPNTFSSLQSPTRESGTVVRFIKAFASPDATDLRTSMVHHTDFGTVTLLANVLGGLQILTPGGDPLDPEAWLYARPQPGCLIVNLGDAMVQWTGGKLRSNCHRINFAPGEQRFVERYSMAILVRPEKEASMKPLVGAGAGTATTAVAGAENGDEDDDITAWEWETEKAAALRRGDAVMQSKGGRVVAVNS